MSKKVHERLKLNKISKKALGIFTLIIVGIGIAGGVTLAKYYANNSNKGVTAAANYYFSSDVLDDALNKEENPEAGDEEWKSVYNTGAWDGKSTYNFNLKIRNYENQLLYNSANLNISYEIAFTLLDNDDGTYQIKNGAQLITLEEGKTVSLSEIIEGGTAMADTFTVVFTAPGVIQDDYESAGVEVVAKITGPEFLTKTETKIGGIIHARTVEAEYSLNGTFDFNVSPIAENWGVDEDIYDMAAFPYAITYTPGTDNAAHRIQISWNAEYLQLDQFDENYGNVETSEDKKTSSLTVLIQPKEDFELIFYRTDKFSLDEIAPKDFCKLVWINDLDLKGSD